jgi:hypothetical protein
VKNLQPKPPEKQESNQREDTPGIQRLASTVEKLQLKQQNGHYKIKLHEQIKQPPKFRPAGSINGKIARTAPSGDSNCMTARTAHDILVLVRHVLEIKTGTL